MNAIGKDSINGSPRLNDGTSLQLYSTEGEVVFSSTGKWLYPLFEVEDYLHAMSLDASKLFLHDRIAGRAAASLIVRMGFKRCFIDTLSTHAEAVFKRFGTEVGYNLLVERIDCRTEELISSDMDIDQVYRMLMQRAGRFIGTELVVRDLHTGFGNTPVLRGINIRLEAGERLVIKGGNGTGKTTLLKCLAGIKEPSAGEILIGGEPASPVKLPSRTGYVNQASKTVEFPVTAAEVVSLGLIGGKLTAEERGYRAEIAMRRTGCFAYAGRDINTLSGGERQRVSLARCMAQNAGLILMDEPTSFLDPGSREDLLELLASIAGRHMPTFIIVSHDGEWIEKLGWPVRELRDGLL